MCSMCLIRACMLHCVCCSMIYKAFKEVWHALCGLYIHIYMYMYIYIYYNTLLFLLQFREIDMIFFAVYGLD